MGAALFAGIRASEVGAVARILRVKCDADLLDRIGVMVSAARPILNSK